MTDPTILVNESHPIPLGWEPDDLVDLWKIRLRHFHLFPRQTRLSACAAEAANALFEQAEREGLDDFMVLSASRDIQATRAMRLRQEDALQHHFADEEKAEKSIGSSVKPSSASISVRGVDASAATSPAMYKGR